MSIDTEESAGCGVSAAFAAWCVFALAASLVLDARAGVWVGQLLGTLLMWAVFLLMCVRATPQRRRLLLKCLVGATVGEFFCSLVWGLYDYRLGNIPPFVPPGHVLMLALGMFLAARLPARGAVLLGRAGWVISAAIALAVNDGLSAPLLAVAFALWWISPAQRPVFAVMMPLSLALELFGTALGVWSWRPQAPWIGLPAHNPPLAAGAFYCVLDWLVLGVSLPRAAAAASSAIARARLERVGASRAA